jgi:hypothetical protein
VDELPPDDDEPDDPGAQGPEEPLVEGAPGIEEDEPPVELEGDEEGEPPPVLGRPAPPELPPVLGRPPPPVLPPELGVPAPLDPPPVLGMPALLPLPPLLPLLPELPPVLGEPALPELPELGEPPLLESSPHPLTMSVALTASANSDGRTHRPVTLRALTVNVFISFYLASRRSEWLTLPRERRLR